MIPATFLPKAERYIRGLRNAAKREYARDYATFIVAHPVTWLGIRGPGYECSYMAAQAVRMHLDALARQP